METYGFIITRHVNSEKTNKYWNKCVKCIRTFYPLKKIIIIDDKLQRMIHHQNSIADMEDYIRPHTPSIRENGLKKVLDGDTSLAEILRVTSAITNN